MAEEKKEGFLQGKTTRREFLKISGTGVAGAAAGIALYNLFGGGKPQGAKVRVFETASGAVVHFTERCSGCLRCETNCTSVNDGKAHPYIARIKVGRNSAYGPHGVTLGWARADGQMGNFRLDGETCKQCAVPACGNACPVGAIKADKTTRARVVNLDKCIGCGSCERACPFHMAVVDPETKKSAKCLLCNGHPACAENCPNGAIRFYSWADCVKLYKERGYVRALNA
jgi:Fe-S-cluster-containing dehydrogenase component